MSWKGMPGPMGIIGGQVERAIDFATNHFGAKKEDILLGAKKPGC